MCKFHKNVALQVATNDNGFIDPVRYGIMMCALSRYWIDLYMPEMAHLDGYSAYEMSTSQAVTALQNAKPLQKLGENIPAIIAYAEARAPLLRSAVDNVIAQNGLTLQSLHLPNNPVNNLKAILKISEGLYEGIPADGLNMRSVAEESRQEPMRKVVAELFDVQGFEPTLKQMMAGSFARLMTEAQTTTNPKLVKVYEHLPYSFRTSFASCAMHGSGGTIGTHALCLMMPAAAGAFGMVASPLIAVGVDRALEWHQGNKFSWKRSASVAAISLAVAFGINAAWSHDHLNTAKAKEFDQSSQDTKDVLLMTYQKEYLALPDDLRMRVDERALQKNMRPEMYLAICDGSDSLGRDIANFNKKQKQQAKDSWSAKLFKAFDL